MSFFVAMVIFYFELSLGVGVLVYEGSFKLHVLMPITFLMLKTFRSSNCVIVTILDICYTVCLSSLDTSACLLVSAI